MRVIVAGASGLLVTGRTLALLRAGTMPDVAQRDRPAVWAVLGCGALSALVLVVSPVALVVAVGSWAGMWDPPGASLFERATVALAYAWAFLLLIVMAAAAGLLASRRRG